jgi:SNF2 family DNA or RNA helicase
VPNGRPSLQVLYDERSVQGRLIGDSQLPQTVWLRVVQALREQDDDVVVREREALAHWPAVVAALQDIATLRATYGFDILPDEDAAERLRVAREERREVHRVRTEGVAVVLTEPEIVARLLGGGFTRRTLRQFQLENLGTLTALQHGANFSVPGAGKTTVSLALHLLIRQPGMHLLVVCPKNAIEAWEMVIDECIDPAASAENALPFVRLDGDIATITTLLRSGLERFIITYDKAIRLQTVLREYLSRHRVHVILDESHRIKAGDASRRGRVFSHLASLPVRRDILTGTPLPNGLNDLGPQMDFLWPTQNLSRRIEQAGSAREVIRNMYVRTTKQDLGLPPRNVQFENVEMGRAQLALYSAIKDPVIRDLHRIRNTGRITITARNNIMRLLEASSNPILAVRKMGATAAPPVSPADAICQAVLEEGDSNKILTAVQMARDLAEHGHKSIIWALFHENIDRLTFLLEDLGVAALDGRVRSGGRNDPDTREGRIAAFHEQDDRMVLVANPAACSEGISLHRVCHNAIYLERSYNAGHYLQSIDRIHRLGMDEDAITNVTILQSIATTTTGSIDHSVGLRMRAKMRAMVDALDDPDIRQLMIDEEDAPVPVVGADFEDLDDLLEQLIHARLPTDDELREDED